MAQVGWPRWTPTLVPIHHKASLFGARQFLVLCHFEFDVRHGGRCGAGRGGFTPRRQEIFSV